MASLGTLTATAFNGDTAYIMAVQAATSSTPIPVSDPYCYKLGIRPAPLMDTWGLLPDPFNADMTGVISGTVVTAGTVPVFDARVVLFARRSLRVVDSTYSDAAGAFSFTKLRRSADAYFVIAFDPDTGAVCNASVLDLLTT